MRLKQTTAPTHEPITLAEAKLHLKVDGTDDDDLITALITVARRMGERETKRAFITQQWEMIMDSAPAGFEIPWPPLQRVLEIKVISAAGVETVVSSSNYDVDCSRGSPGRVKLAFGSIWPTHRNFASFIVTFDAGYGDKAENIPEPLRQGILILIGNMYEHRGDAGVVKARVQAIDEAKIYFGPFKIWNI